jgi:hypothetical protein
MCWYQLFLWPNRNMSILSVGVPQVHHFGQEGLHNVLVIDLLGPNLEDLFDMCGRKFTIKTVCMSAKQMVSLYSSIGQVLFGYLLSFSMHSVVPLQLLMSFFRYLASSPSTTSRSFTVISSLTIFSSESLEQKPPTPSTSLVCLSQVVLVSLLRPAPTIAPTCP